MHTIKSLDFIDDYTFVTGSDDFGIYAWNVPYPDGVDNPIDGTESDEHDKSFRSDSTVYGWLLHYLGAKAGFHRTVEKTIG